MGSVGRWEVWEVWGDGKCGKCGKCGEMGRWGGNEGKLMIDCCTQHYLGKFVTNRQRNALGCQRLVNRGYDLPQYCTLISL